MISALTEKYPCFGVKWFPLLFSFQSIFGLRHAQRERERERERERGEKSEPRNQLRLTQKTQDRAPSSSNAQTHSIAPSQTLIAPITPSARSSHPSIDPPKTDRSRAIFVRCWEFGFCFFWVLMNLGFVLDPASSSSTHIRRPHSSNPVASLSLSLSLSLSQFDQIWWIFLLGFVSFVFIYWEMILIFVWKMRKCEKMWETW